MQKHGRGGKTSRPGSLPQPVPLCRGTPGGRRALGWSHRSLGCPRASSQALPFQAFGQGHAPRSRRGHAQSLPARAAIPPHPLRAPHRLHAKTHCTSTPSPCTLAYSALEGMATVFPIPAVYLYSPLGRGMPKIPWKYCKT